MPVTTSLTQGDLADWTSLWSDYNAFYGRAGSTALSPEIVKTAWTRLLDPAVPQFGVIARIDGVAVGLAHVIVHPNMIQVAPTAYLQDLYAIPTVRGRGVGRALISAAEAVSKAHGALDMYWHTQADNAGARRLYDAVATETGFIVYRRRSQV